MYGYINIRSYYFYHVIFKEKPNEAWKEMQIKNEHYFERKMCFHSHGLNFEGKIITAQSAPKLIDENGNIETVTDSLDNFFYWQF